MSNTIDIVRVHDAWTEKEIELGLTKEGAEPMTADEKAIAKKDFHALDAQRYYKDDSFEFRVQTVGVYTCDEIAKLGCEALDKLLAQFSQKLEAGVVQIIPSKTTMENSWVVKIGGDCYTIGNIVEWIMYVLYYLPTEMGGKGGKDPLLTFCAFRKSHPHDDEANLNLAFVAETDQNGVGEYLSLAIAEARRVIAEMNKLF